MSLVTTFDSTKEALVDILRSIQHGKTQLPDFQRGWVWDDDHVRGLLSSISLSYPIGAVMMLQTGNEDVRFKPRLVEGVVLPTPPQPERLILDGQQRLTSLFQALVSSQPVQTRDARGKTIKRWYYINICKALDPTADREEAIIGVPEDRIIRNFRGEVEGDYSTVDKEIAAELFPISLMFDTIQMNIWQMKYVQAVPEQMVERMNRWSALMLDVVQRFQQYQVPVIMLRKETPKEAVCQVFEKVNTGGVSLNVFELLTATFAVDDFNLRDDWAKRSGKFRSVKTLAGIENTDFLQAVSLLATRARRLGAIAGGIDADKAPGITCKRKDVLRISLQDYKLWADAVTSGFERAARLLHSQKMFDSRDLPYRTQLTPLAAILAVLGDRADHDSVRAKLLKWYWCGVFGELYGGAIETRFARDLPEVLAWIENGPEPSTVVDANFNPSRLLTLRTRNSAAYKGLYSLLLRDGGYDFRTGEAVDVQMYFDDSIDIHHIFPQAWCRSQGIPATQFDSIINKTPLSAKTNRIVGGKAPSSYLASIMKGGISEARIREILKSHVIEPDALLADDFAAFFTARREALLDRIEAAMGKPLARDVVALLSAEEPEVDSDIVDQADT